MAASIAHAWRRYLLLFAHEHLEFRIPELLSIAKLHEVKYAIPEGGFHEHSPCLVIDVQSEESIHQIMSRTMLVKSAFELWGKGRNYKELEKDLKKFPVNLKEPYLEETKSFCVRMETFNKVLTMEEKIENIEVVLGMDAFRGQVNLRTPDVRFQLLAYYGQQTLDAPNTPEFLWFGRWIANGQRDIIKNYSLQNRKYIGNTSMDPALSFIMSNMGCVHPGDLVYDPFVGTGSLLVSCAHFGAYVTGTDIDYKLLMGRGKASKHGQKWRSKETDNIRANLQQYGLHSRYLDALVADASLHHLWRADVQFDAIISDPPYGVRESTERVGAKKNSETVEIPEHLKEAHIPCRVQYHISDVMRDLLSFAARHLRLHGRLVYWLPVYRPEYSDSQVPTHPCLKLVANSEQGLTRSIGRRLITMEKVSELEPEHLTKTPHTEDHYKEATFRDMYFRPSDWEKRKQRKTQTTDNDSNETCQTGSEETYENSQLTECTEKTKSMNLNDEKVIEKTNPGEQIQQDS